jgi:hypothetical protein
MIRARRSAFSQAAALTTKQRDSRAYCLMLTWVCSEKMSPQPTPVHRRVDLLAVGHQGIFSWRKAEETRPLFSLFSNDGNDRPTRDLAHADTQTDGKAGLGSGSEGSEPRSGFGHGPSSRILGFRAEGPSRRHERSSTVATSPRGDPAPRSARLVPSMRAYHGDPTADGS